MQNVFHKSKAKSNNTRFDAFIIRAALQNSSPKEVNMRGSIICVCLIILGLLATSATAAPKTKVPSWDDYFTSDSSGPLPQSDPSYRGAVTLWSDGTMTPSGQYLHIHQPYDMTNSKDIVLSNYAKDYGLVYASATVKSFLEATARQMRTQMKDTALRIPVFPAGCKRRPYS